MQFNSPIPEEVSFYANFKNNIKDFSLNQVQPELKNNATITDSGVLFAGGNNNGYISVSGYDFYKFENNDFTIQCWFYLNQGGALDTIFAKAAPQNLNNLYSLELNQFGNLHFYVENSSQELNTPLLTGPQLLTGQWYHVAISRNGSDTRLFLDGVEVDSVNENYNIVSDATSVLSIGNNIYQIGSRSLDGYIRDFEVIENSGKYTSNFDTKEYQYNANVNPFIFASGTANTTIFTS